MDDLISRATAIKCAIDAIDDWEGGWNPNREVVIRKYFEELPAVDAVPVVHGRWIYEHDDPTMLPCSVCGYRVFRYNNTRYCPNCGARMDGDNDDE